MANQAQELISLKRLMGAHLLQLTKDDNSNKTFNMTSYSRATFSAIEGNKIFPVKQNTLAETIAALGTTQFVTVPAATVEGVTNTRRNLKTCSPMASKNLSDTLSQEMDKTLDYYRVAALSVGGSLLKPQWDGQFLVRICNPKKPILEIRMLKFVPDIREADVKNLQNNNAPKHTQKAMYRNLCRFEMSRQFVVKIPLGDLSKFYLHKTDDTSCLAVVTLELENSKGIHFLQKHTLTNFKDRWNKWKRRRDFFQGKPSTQHSFRLVLGGDYSDMLHLVANALKVSTRAADVYKQGETVPIQPFEGPKQAPCMDQNKASKAESKPEKPKFPRITAKKQKLRKEILDVLVKEGLIEKDKADLLFKEPKNMEAADAQRPSKINNYIGDMGLHQCFQEFINFRCTNVGDMIYMLVQPLEAEEFGFDKEALGIEDEYDEDDEDDEYDEDKDDEDEDDEDDDEYREYDEDGNCIYRRKKEKGTNINTMTAGELLKHTKRLPGPDIDPFFSFCWGHLAQDMCTSHCPRCHDCKDWREWHCYNCDRCSYGQSIPQCQHCGCRNSLSMFTSTKPTVRPALDKQCMLKSLLHFSHLIQKKGSDGEERYCYDWPGIGDDDVRDRPEDVAEDDGDDDFVDEEECFVDDDKTIDDGGKVTPKTSGTSKITEDADKPESDQPHVEENIQKDVGTDQTKSDKPLQVAENVSAMEGLKTEGDKLLSASTSDSNEPAGSQPMDSSDTTSKAETLHDSAASDDTDDSESSSSSEDGDESDDSGGYGSYPVLKPRREKKHSPSYYMKRGWHFSDDEDDVFRSPVPV